MLAGSIEYRSSTEKQCAINGKSCRLCGSHRATWALDRSRSGVYLPPEKSNRRSSTRNRWWSWVSNITTYFVLRYLKVRLIVGCLQNGGCGQFWNEHDRIYENSGDIVQNLVYCIIVLVYSSFCFHFFSLPLSICLLWFWFLFDCFLSFLYFIECACRACRI